MKKLFLLCAFVFANIAFAQIQNPESVIWNEATESYIISDAAQGILYSMTIDGEVKEFTTGLTSPKGIALGTLSLWVTDVKKIVEIDILSGDKIKEYPIPNAQFLNDIVADPLGYLYISDMQANKIYEFDELMGAVTTSSKGQLTAPNGLVHDVLGGLIIVSFAPNANVYTMDLQEGNVEVLKTTNLGQLDGIAYDSKRDRYYISAWEQGAVYIFDSSFMDEPQLLIDGLNGPADIYYDENRDVLVIPEMNTGKIIFYDFNHTDVREIANSDIKIYPNPANEYIIINLQNEIKSNSVKIFNSYGNEIGNYTLDHSGNDIYQIDISSLPQGMYYLKIDDRVEQFTILR